MDRAFAPTHRRGVRGSVGRRGRPHHRLHPSSTRSPAPRCRHRGGGAGHRAVAARRCRRAPGPRRRARHRAPRHGPHRPGGHDLHCRACGPRTDAAGRCATRTDAARGSHRRRDLRSDARRILGHRPCRGAGLLRLPAHERFPGTGDRRPAPGNSARASGDQRGGRGPRGLDGACGLGSDPRARPAKPEPLARRTHCRPGCPGRIERHLAALGLLRGAAPRGRRRDVGDRRLAAALDPTPAAGRGPARRARGRASIRADGHRPQLRGPDQAADHRAVAGDDRPDHGPRPGRHPLAVADGWPW